MLEIISLIVITKYIGQLAESKDLDPRKWKFFTIILFLFLEITGYYISLFFVSKDNLITIALIGFGFGITSYPLIESYLRKKPDVKKTEL